MKVLGCDLSVKRSGLGLWDMDRSRVGTIQTRSIHADDIAQKKGVSTLDVFTDEFDAILAEWKPDFVAFEAPEEQIRLFKGQDGRMTCNPSSTLGVNRIYGCAKAVVRIRRLPWEIVSPATWRKKLYGFGTKTEWQPADWKRHARSICQSTYQVNAKNGDEAEGALIALYAEHMQTLKLILNRREAA